MRRILSIALGLVLAAVVLPPLWYTVVGSEPAPPLPPRGTRVVLADGVGINVVESGSGPAVVMVHGLPGSAYDWRETTRALAARGHRAIAYDRVGYGHSDAPADGSYTPGSNARELLGVLEALELSDVTVAGWSYGGVTALLAAQIDPSRIGRLVLVGTGGPSSEDDTGPPEPGLVMRLFYSEAALRWRAMVPPIAVGLMRVLSAQAFSQQPQPDWWLEGLRANFARPATTRAYRAEMFGMAADTSGPDLDPSAVRLPALVLHGDDDRLAPVEIARYMASRMPSATLVEYAGASHMLPVTHAEEIADRIAAFARDSPVRF